MLKSPISSFLYIREDKPFNNDNQTQLNLNELAAEINIMHEINNIRQWIIAVGAKNVQTEHNMISETKPKIIIDQPMNEINKWQLGDIRSIFRVVPKRTQSH